MLPRTGRALALIAGLTTARSGDPQAPDSVISVTALFTPMGGRGQPTIPSVRPSFETQFLVMEFPDVIAATITAPILSGPRFDFALSFAQRQPPPQFRAHLPIILR